MHNLCEDRNGNGRLQSSFQINLEDSVFIQVTTAQLSCPCGLCWAGAIMMMVGEGGSIPASASFCLLHKGGKRGGDPLPIHSFIIHSHCQYFSVFDEKSSESNRHSRHDVARSACRGCGNGGVVDDGHIRLYHFGID